MAPAGKTSLIVEMPCQMADEIWESDDASLVARATASLARMGWVDGRSTIGTEVVRLPNAYPILTIEAEQAAGRILDYLKRFDNLSLLGRNGVFQYTWLHSVLRMGKDLVAELT